MMHWRAIVTHSACAFVIFGNAACGGAAQSAGPAAPSSPATAPSASASESAAMPPERVDASTVRFSDLGIAFTVPPGYRVIGDDELAARVRASADLKLDRSLRDRAQDKKGLPLLTLEKQTTSADDFLTISLTVVPVPKDAKATEVAAQQESVMKDHLAGFKLVDAVKAKTTDGVDGAELSTAYLFKRGGEAKRTSSLFRLFVREGLATMAVAVWPEGVTARGEEGRLVLDGLHFESATPPASCPTCGTAGTTTKPK